MNDATAILEVIVDGIGYETDLDIELMQQVAWVAGQMAEVIGQFRQEIVAAVSLAVTSIQAGLPSDDEFSVQTAKLL